MEGGIFFLLLLELPPFGIFVAYIWVEVAGERTSGGVGVVLTPEL